MADIRQNIKITAQDQTTKGFRSVQKNLSTLDRFLTRIQTTLLGFVGLNIATNLVRDLVRISDVAAELDAKMGLVTSSLSEVTAAQDGLLKASLATGGSLEANTVLFTRLANPVKALGFNLQETLKLTELTDQGLRISGASAQESASVIRQLSQAYQSGVLRGEEFNSLMENGGRIAYALADGLGVSLGQLRAMSKQGQLTSDIVVKALLEQSAVIDAENKKLPLTIGRSLQNIKNQFLAFNQANSEANAQIAQSINLIAENMDTLISVSIVGAKTALIALGFIIIKNSTARIKAYAEEAVAAKNQAVLDAKKKADSIQQGLIDARNHAAKTQATALELHGERLKAQAKNATLAATVKSLQLQIQESNATRQRQLAAAKDIVDTNMRAQALAKLGVSYQANIRLTENLTRAKAALAASETALTAAITKETMAVEANTFAQIKNLSAMKSGTSKAAGFVKVMGKLPALLGRVASGLLGIPGLILFAASQFIDLGLGVKALTVQLSKFLTILTNPIDAIFGGGDLDIKLADIDNKFADWSDKRIADQNAVAAGYENAEDRKRKAALETQRQIVNDENRLSAMIQESASLRDTDLENATEYQQAVADAEMASYEARVNRIDRELELEKSKLAELSLTQADYEEAVTQATLAANTEKLELLKGSLKFNLQEWDKFYNERKSQVEDNNSEVAKLEVAQLEMSKQIYQEGVDALSDSVSEMIDRRKDLLDSIRNGEQNIRDLQKESAEFFRDLNESELSDAQKSADARRQIQEIQAELRRADQMDQVKDAAEIKRIRTEAASDLQEIALAERDRAKETKNGSSAELEATTNKTTAAQLYKSVINDTIAAQKDMNLRSAEEAKSAQSIIQERAESLETYQKAIRDIDAQLMVSRQVALEVNTDEVRTQLEQIDAGIKKLSQKIKVTISQSTVQERKAGGLINETPQGFNTGGHVPREGKLSGYGGGDKVKALLEAGEFIVKKEAVKSLGLDALHMVNAGVLPDAPIKRQTGGEVDYNQRTDRFISRQRDKFDTFRKLKSSQPVGNVNSAEKLDKMRYSYLFPNTYIPKIIELSENLRGMEGKDFRRGRNLLSAVSSIVYRSPSKKTRGAAEDKLEQFNELMNKVNNTSTTFASTAMNNPSVKLATNRVATAREAANAESKSASVSSFGALGLDSPSKEASANTSSNPLPATFSSLKKSVTDSIIRSTVNGVDTFTQKTAANQPRVAGTGIGSSGGSSETIDVNLNINGSVAKGTFENNAQTKEIFETLRNEGGAKT